MKVLVVEDNEDSRNLLVKQLSAYGNEVVAAADGVAALEQALKDPPDILVSDILMPRMDGYQLCYEWKRDKRLKDIPFVFYTAIYTSRDDEKFALRLGASHFIRKPLEPEALAKMLSQLLEQAREGLLPVAEAAPPKPSLYLNEYNKRLVAKLNEKVAELERSEGELKYLSSVLGAIRDINQLIVRERDKTKLLQSACKILLNVRAYRFVWIGLIEEGHKRVIPVAKAGVEDKYLDSVETTWDDSPSGRGPAGTAIKTKQPDLIKDIPANQRTAPWREEALKRGYRSAAAFPLIHGDQVYGVLNVYSRQPDGFNDTEVGLLEEVSSDLGFALRAIEEEEGRKQAEEALGEAEREKAIILNSLSEIVTLQALNHRMIWVNKAAGDSVGLSTQELAGRCCYEVWGESSEPCAGCPLIKVRQTGKPQVGEMTTPDGRIWSVRGYPVRDADGNLTSIVEVTLEITERKWAEEALRESEAFQAELLANSPIPISVVNPDTSIKYINPAMEGLTGFSAEEIIGQKAPHPFWPKENVARIMKDFKRTMRQGSGQATALFERKNGEKFWVEVSAVPLKKDGKFQYLLVSWVDITERKRAEEALQESNKRFSDIAENALEWIWEVDAKGRYTYASPIVEQTLGYKPEEVVGKYFYELFLPDEREELKKAVFAMFAEKRPFRQFSNRHVHKNGEIVWLFSNGVPILDEAGNLLGYRGADVDITEQKKAEEALQLRAQMLDGATDAIFVHDVDENFVYVNEAACRILGYSREEFLKMGVRQLFPPDELDGLAAIRQDTLGKGELVFEAVHLSKDGSRMPVEIHSRTIESGGRKLILAIARDITERKRAEDALRESEARYRAVIEGAHDMIQSVGLDGRIIFVNRSWLDTLGYTEAELSALTLIDIIHPDSLEHCRKMFEQVAKGKSFHGVEATFLTKDGREILVEGNAAPRYIGDRVVATQGVFHDITERRRAQEVLERSEANLAAAQRVAKLGSWERDLATQKDSWSLEMYRLTGFDPAKGLPPNFDDFLEFVHPEDRDVLQGFDAQVRDTGEPAIFEFRSNPARGPVHIFRASVEAIRDGEGRAVKVVGAIQDITESKQAEEALRESEEKYKTLVEATSDVIWEANGEGVYTFISPNIKDVLGYEVDEVVGKKRTLDLAPKDEVKKWLKRLKEINAKKVPFFGFEVLHLHKNGSPVIFEVSGIPLFDSGGNFKGFVGINKDITGRKQMQEQLVITDRLASVGELAAGIAHELNNPLTGVIGFSQLLMDKKMPDDIRQDVQVIYSEAQRAAQVVKNLLTFARKHTAAKQMLNINSIIEKVLELRAYEQKVENIKVEGNLDHNLPEIMADYFQLQQVFLNIIINAEFFMKEAHGGGTLTITTERVGNKVKASFADDGPGITKDDLGHLFDPFFTTKEVGKGTGLGLSICHGIIGEHGGRIYAESEPGKGANFIVEMPISAAGKKGGAE